MEGFAFDSSENIDAYVSRTLQEQLFVEKPERELLKKDEMVTAGLDLVALNIQRGRDHGVAGFGHAMKHCNIKYFRPKLTSLRLLLPRFYGAASSRDREAG